MWVFSLRRNVVIFPTDLRVGAATEKALVQTFLLTLGTKSRLELDDQSCLGCKYAGCLDESAHNLLCINLP